MVPPQLLADAAAAQSAIVTLAQRDVAGAWRAVDLSDARTATAALNAVVGDVVASYGELSAVAAADFYDEARSASRPSGGFRALAADTAPAGQVDAMVRWAVTPLWADEPRADAALARLSGGVSRLVQQPERETIWQNAQRDPARPRYARVPMGPEPCPFCLMLASRGGVYESEDVAVTAQSGGRAGMSYHDDCHCRPQPVWRPDDLQPVNVRLAQEWADVTADTFGPEEARAAWREHVENRP